MAVTEIRVTSQFEKNYKKLPKRIRDLAKEKEKIFCLDPFDPGLETHKLHGKEKEHWAYSINRQYRIKFLFLTGYQVLYLDIGTHRIYS